MHTNQSEDAKELYSGASPLLRCNYDILYTICKEVWNLPRSRVGNELDVHAFARTCRRIRHFMAPDLYKTISIGPMWGGDRELSALESVERCKEVKQYARKFVVSLYLGRDFKPTALPEELPVKLARILVSLKRLETVAFVVPVWHAEPLRVAFESAQVILPTVSEVNLSMCMDWIIPMCPSVTKISTHGWTYFQFRVSDEQVEQYMRNVINYASNTENLEHFGLSGSTNPAMVQSILTSLPNLSSLEFDEGRGLDLTRRSIIDLAPLYGRFESLLTLILPHVYYLNVGYHPPKCGNAYMGPHGRQVRERVDAERRRAEKNVAKSMFGACAKLEVLWIGDDLRAKCARSSTGSVMSVDLQKTRRNRLTYSPC